MSEGQYRWDPAEYARHSPGQNAWARELIGKLNLGGDEAILDIGCGDGRATALLASQTPRGRVVGIDSSAEMIALAERSHPPAAHPNLSFRCMDAAELAFDEAFDLVFSNAALHWIRDQAAVLSGVFKSLRLEGRLLFQMGGRGNGAAIIAVIDRVRSGMAWRPYFEGFRFPYTFSSVDEYKRLLDEAGFQARRIELLDKDMRHRGSDGLAGWIRTTWLPYLQRLPDYSREAFIGEVVENYVKQFPADQEGMVHVAMVRLEVEAVRMVGKPAGFE